MMEVVNHILWVAGNIIILLIFVAALSFAIIYPLLFNPKLTTGGRLVWRAIFSVAGIGLMVVIGLFVDGRSEWWELPPNILWWRPALRVLVYGYVAYSFGSLVALLFVRRFWPKQVEVAPEVESTLSVRPRKLGRR